MLYFMVKRVVGRVQSPHGRAAIADMIAVVVGMMSTVMTIIVRAVVN